MSYVLSYLVVQQCNSQVRSHLFLPLPKVGDNEFVDFSWFPSLGNSRLCKKCAWCLNNFDYPKCADPKTPMLGNVLLIPKQNVV